MSVTQIRRTTHGGDHRVSPVFLAVAAVAAASGWGVWTHFAANTGFAVFLFVASAWVVSLCLHEYAHARTAFHSGDLMVGAKGYLTLNPLKYTHAVLSILLPLLFVVMGGIGLPGGAVFIDRGRIRGRVRNSLISAAGPLANMVFAVLLMLPFTLGWTDGWPADFSAAFAFLAMLQVTAAVLNLLPVPGLDGYGIVEPWLSYGVRRQVEPYAQFGLIAVFGVLYIQSVNDTFFRAVFRVMGWFHVDGYAMVHGQYLFQFWKH